MTGDGAFRPNQLDAYRSGFEAVLKVELKRKGELDTPRLFEGLATSDEVELSVVGEPRALAE